MLSVGIDLIELGRIKKAMRNPRFCGRILGDAEYIQLKMRGFPVQSVAASFCAKEAFSKALGTGMRDFSFREIELLRGEHGRPYLRLSGKALRAAQERRLCFAVSATHTREYASVVVIGEECASDEGSGQ